MNRNEHVYFCKVYYLISGCSYFPWLLASSAESADVNNVCVCVTTEMVRGWWWVKQPEELTAILQALHPRGVREKVLHKHLTKHLEFLSEVCSRPSSGKNNPLPLPFLCPFFLNSLEIFSPICIYRDILICVKN